MRINATVLISAALLVAPLAAHGQAVSALNGKLSLEGGVAGIDGRDKAAGIASGSFSLPIGTSFGLQVDGTAGASYGGFNGGAGGQLFWRNPQSGLLGLTGSYSKVRDTAWARLGGEGEFYLSSFTLAAQAGYQFADRGHQFSDFSSYRVKSGFYGGGDISLYATPDFMLTVGGGNYAGDWSGRGGVEWQPGITGWNGMAFFAHGALGESGYYQALAGVRFYFGADKPLMRRHREDDPVNRLDEGLIAERSGFCKRVLTTRIDPCSIGEVSDRRLKRDIVKVSELEGGIGLYRYHYVWGGPEYVGVMAQELLAKKPDAVLIGSDGFYRVDYGKLGTHLMTMQQWQAYRLTGNAG